MMDGFNFWIVTLSPYIGVGLFLDLVVVAKHRHAISWYVFGYSEADTTRLELTLMRALISIFVKSGWIEFYRVLIYSIFFSAICLVLLAVNFLGIGRLLADREIPSFSLEDFFSSQFLIVLLFISTVTGFVTSWFDFLSLWLSKFLFVNKSPQFPKSLMFLLIDVLCSVGVGALLVWIVTNPSEGVRSVLEFISMKPQLAVYLAYIATLSALFFSIIQLVIFVVGAICRILIGITKLNQVVSIHSHVHDFPFTYLLLVLGVFYAVSKLIIS